MPLSFNLDSLKDNCWKFAIEMELWRWNSWVAKRIWKSLWKDVSDIWSHLECWYRIEETTVRSDDFLAKYELFNQMCTRDKAIIWSDWSIAWWCHCHMFFKPKRSDELTHEALKNIALYCYRVPFYLRSNSMWVIIRHRWYDDYLVSYARADIRDQRSTKWSIEMRFNEQVHWANLYFYLFACDRVVWKLSRWFSIIHNLERDNLVKEVNYTLYKWSNLYYCAWVDTNDHTDYNDIYDIQYSSYRIDSNWNFPPYVNNIIVPISDIVPAYNWNWFRIEELVNEFSLFNTWIKFNVLDQHKEELYKYFSQNMRWYPRAWKKKLLLSIPREDWKLWKWMLPQLYWPEVKKCWRIIWRYTNKLGYYVQYPKTITYFDEKWYDNQLKSLTKNPYKPERFYFKYENNTNVENR